MCLDCFKVNFTKTKEYMKVHNEQNKCILQEKRIQYKVNNKNNIKEKITYTICDKNN